MGIDPRNGRNIRFKQRKYIGVYVFLNYVMIGYLHDLEKLFIGRTLLRFLLLFVCKCNWIDAISSKKLDPRIDLTS